MTQGSSRPRLLVVAGPNGAGKTTITERGLAHEWFGGCEYVNPDLVAQELGDWNDRDAELVVRASGGRVVKTYVEPPTWMAPIVQRLSPAVD